MTPVPPRSSSVHLLESSNPETCGDHVESRPTGLRFTGGTQVGRRRVWLGFALGLALVRLAVPAGAAPDQVVVVFKTHFDLGYTDMASNVVQRYRTTMIDQALEVVEANRSLPPEQQFVWTLPGWPLAKILEDWPGQTSERRQRAARAFREGRFVVHALPATTHTELLEPEDLVRGLGYASQLSRAASLALPRDAKMTDVPSHSWILPTLLRHAGVDFLHLGCNAASRSPRVPMLFWWEGPDGSRLLTMYTAESYGTGMVPPSNWPYRTWLALIHTGDNHGPPRPDEVKKLLDEAAAKLPGVRVRIGRLSDFAAAVVAEGATIPVVRGDMPDTWIHGPLSDPAGASLARRTRPRIAMAEALDTCLNAWGVTTPAAAETLAQAYDQSLLYGEHTWGGAYWWIYGKYLAYYGRKWTEEREAGRFQRIESSWAEHTAYIERAAQLTDGLLIRELDLLARSVQVAGRRVVVFNPSPWRRSGSVLLPASSPPMSALRPADGGTTVPVATGLDGAQVFTASDLPPGGYRTYVPAELPNPSPQRGPARFDPASGAIETPFFRAVLDTNRFVLRSLVERRSGRQLVNPGAPHGFGQVVYERFSSNEVAAFVKAYVKITADWATNELGKPMLPPAEVAPYRQASPGRFRISVRESEAGLEVAGVADEPVLGNPTFAARFVFPVDAPYVDLVITCQKPPDPWPEAGWIALPFEVASPRFQLGRLGSILDPAKDVVAGANRHLFALNTGLTVTDAAGAGAGLCAVDSPLVSLGEPGCWRYSVEDFPRPATVYVNLFNNQWTTNFRLWTEGRWTSRVRVWAVVPGADAAESLVTPSLEARAPLQSFVAEGPAGELPATGTGLGLSRPGVQVTAFGPNPDGTGTILRLWELAGQSGRCAVRLPGRFPATSAQPVDLRGRPIGAAVPIREGGFEVELKAFAPTSLRLETAATLAAEQASPARTTATGIGSGDG